VAVLVAVPLALFVIPALFGKPAIAGDNLIQNFPLRVLSGDQIRQGHLPLWNPYIWSGSPLLGGLNAGSAYPFTFLFAVLGPVAAWIVNLLVIYWAAALGLYALLRQFRLRPVACVVAALTYAFAGAMSGEMVHIGVVQGMGWMPLLVLAQLRLSWVVFGVGPASGDQLVDRPDPDDPDGAPVVPPVGRTGSPWPWTVLLAVMAGFVFLTGEPRSMAEAEIVAGFVFIWLVLRPYAGAGVPFGRRVRYLGYSALGAVWGAALGAVQLLVGWHFISTSQRSSETYAFFSSGSLRPPWSVLMLVPDLFGGDGILHQPPFFNSYNLPEVTGYIGLLPLAAGLALATRSFGRHRDLRSSDWGLWLGLAVLGTLLTFGSFTPLGPVFGHIPFFNKVRLQSRNLAIVDLSLAVLLGFWADRLLGRRSEDAGISGWRRWVTVSPVLAAIALCVVAIAIPEQLERSFGSVTTIARALSPWFIAQLVVAVAAAALLLFWPRIPIKYRARFLVAVVVLDLVLFTVSTSVGLSDGNATAQPTTRQATAVLGNSGRFAIYDTTALNIDDLSKIGQPDLNVFTGLSSVQGYGSILSNSYGSATGTHDLDTLDPCALSRGAFVPLRLTSLLSLPEFLAPETYSNGTTAFQEGSPPPGPPGGCPGAVRPGTPHQRTWYLGQPMVIRSIRIGVAPDRDGHRPGLSGTRFGVLTAPNQIRWPKERLVAGPGATISVLFVHPQRALGVVVHSASGQASRFTDDSVVATTNGLFYSFNGELQDALGVGGWRFTGRWLEYARFEHPMTLPPVWVAGSPDGAAVQQLSAGDQGTEVDRLNAPRPVTVVRSEAYAAGWHVEAVPVGGGPTRSLSVYPVGLVQGVRVPAGRWTLTFLYRPAGLDLGLAGTLAGLLALVGSAALAGRRRSLRRSLDGTSRGPSADR
jgi:hypothetical protein